MDKAREAAEADHARMLAELRREVGRLVVETTAKVTGKVLTLEDQQRLAEETSRNWRLNRPARARNTTLKISKQARRDAKQLFRGCLRRWRAGRRPRSARRCNR